MAQSTVRAIAATALALACCRAVAYTVSITDSPISGPTGGAGTDWWIYKYVPPDQLVRDETEPLGNVLQGEPPVGGNTAPQGNVELFANSELPPYSPAGGGVAGSAVLPGSPFQTVPRTTFSGLLNTFPITLGSLNGDDWFASPGPYDISYSRASTTLAQRWFNDLLDFYNFDTIMANALVSAPIIEFARIGLFQAFRDQANGFQRFSDPNVPYVNLETTTGLVSVGLAGTTADLNALIEFYVGLAPILTDDQKASIIAQLQQVDIQASELVRTVLDGGAPQYLYGFVSAPVGLTTTDPTESYNANFDLSLQLPGVPEPASALLALGALLAAGFRRR